MSFSSTQSTVIVDQVTILSFLTTLALLIIAYLVSVRLLLSTTSAKLRVLFIWHAFDVLIHFVLEGSFLYNCFFTYTSIVTSNDYPHPASLTEARVFFWDTRIGSMVANTETVFWRNYGRNMQMPINDGEEQT